jgi:hypothetical protein
MRTGLSLWLIGGALTVALPQGAEAQSSAFDGTYVGVSATYNGQWRDPDAAARTSRHRAR